MRALRVQRVGKIVRFNKFAIILIMFSLLSNLFAMSNKDSVNLIDVKQLSEKLAISKFTIYTWVSQSRIPHLKIGGRLVRFEPEEIEKWVKVQRVKPNEVWTS